MADATTAPTAPTTASSGSWVTTLLARLRRPAPARSWLASLGAGMAAVLGFWLAGGLWAEAYDETVLPVVYGLLRFPHRWAVTGLLLLLVLFRPETTSRWRWVPTGLLGGWLGLLVVNDWWYVAPCLTAVVATLAVWRIRWTLWPRPFETAVGAATCVGVVLLGAVFDLFESERGWDNRFGFGHAAGLNVTATVAVVGAVVAVVAGWVLWHLRTADQSHRRLLLDPIEREPRLARYFAWIARLTPISIPGGSGPPGRFPSAAVQWTGGQGAEVSVVWHSWQRSWQSLRDSVARVLRPRRAGVEGTDQPLPPIFPEQAWFPAGRDVLWGAAYLATAASPVAALIRWVRRPLRRPGLPSAALRAWVKEGVWREHNAWLAAWLVPGRPESPEPVELLKQLGLRDSGNRRAERERADRHFARYVLLREAQIEAELYFGLPLPAGDAPAVAAEALPFQSPWDRVGKEYLALWFDAVDRLFLTRGDAFTLPLLTPADILDVAALAAGLQRPDDPVAVRLLSLLGGGVQRGLPARGAPPSDPGPLLRELVRAFNRVLATVRLDLDPAFQQIEWPAGVRELSASLPDPRLGPAGGAMAARVRVNRRLLEAAFPEELAVANDPVDLERLTRTLLACRRAAGGSAASVFRRDADRALELFVLPPAEAAAAAQQLETRHFDSASRLGTKAPASQQLEGSELREAGLCAVAYGLWQLGQGNLPGAIMPLAAATALNALQPTSDQGANARQFAAQCPRVLQAALHLNASALAEDLRRTAPAAPSTFQQSWLTRVLAHHLQLDQHPEPAGGLFDGRVSGATLACVYAGRLLN